MNFEELSCFSVKIKNFKCFGEEAQGFDLLKPINVILGRNNSGKSSLIGLIKYATKTLNENRTGLFKVEKELTHNNSDSQLIFSTPLVEEHISKVFQQKTSGGVIPGEHWSYGRHLRGLKFTWSCGNQGKRFVALEDSKYSIHLKTLDGGQAFIDKLAIESHNLLFGKKLYEITPDRDLTPEIDQGQQHEIKANGEGFTNLIQKCINKAELNKRDLVEKKLLNSLNEIFSLDAKFDRILCQQFDDGKWEIYLEEQGKGRIPLSQSGHGLKTIIMVLCYIILVPEVLGIELDQCIFAFEELENNLHPALLRRLLNYLEKVAIEEKCLFFLSTHSSIVIDLFSRSQNAQIVHVTHDGKQSKVKAVNTYVENKDLLFDLGIRASDLLQANCIIWVEGPSDRIYINRWIELWSEGELKEGNHYQCVFYGGGLRSHLSAEDPDEVASHISIFRVNHNAIIISDSDKLSQQTPVSLTKQKIHIEIEQNGGLGWITKGRDIENYLSKDIVSRWLEDKVDEDVGLYEDFFEYLPRVCNDSTKEKARKKNDKKYKKAFNKRKQLFALQIAPLIEKPDFSDFLDLDEKINNICQKIKDWNHI